jgi:HD-like signal output (HDOD) protein
MAGSEGGAQVLAKGADGESTMLPASTSAEPFENLEQHFKLPPVPRLLARLLDVLRSERSDAHRAARVIERDPALSAEVLRVVNSAYYALPRQVSELRFAIAYLGLGEVGRIAMSYLAVEALRPKDKQAEEQLSLFWRQSYLTTLAARRVLRHVPGVDSSDDLYSAALLHQIGVLAYLRCDAATMRRIDEVSQRDGLLYSEAAEQLGVVAPKKLGATLAKRWGLPASITRATAFHDLQDLTSLPSDGAGAPFDIAICVGSLVVEHMLRPLSDEVSDAIAFQIKRVMGWSHEDYLFLLGEGEEWKLQADQFLRGAV